MEEHRFVKDLEEQMNISNQSVLKRTAKFGL